MMDSDIRRRCGTRTAPRVATLLLVFLCLLPVCAFSVNGQNMIGFGTKSIGMGGADLAVARDTTAMNTNPAGIARIPGSALDLYNAFAYPLSVVHRDQFGNDAEVSNRLIVLASGGYTRQLGGRPVTMGIGFFAQGGSGNVFKRLATPFGTRDELFSQLRIGKVTPTVAYKVNDSLSLGVSLLDPIGEHTGTFGGGYSFSKRWQVNAAAEYNFRNHVRYNNPQLPIGPGAEEEQEVIVAHVMLSRRW